MAVVPYTSAPSLTHVGFITDSFLNDKAKLFEGGAERHLLHLARVASSLGAEVTIYQRGRRDWEGTYEGIPVVTQPGPLRGLGSILAKRAIRDRCTHLHFQYLEAVPYGISGPCLTATSHGIYWDIPYLDKYRAWYPGGRASALTLPAWRLHERRRSLAAVRRCHLVLATDTSLLRFVQSHRPDLRQRIEVVMNFTDLGSTPEADAGSLTHPELRPLAEARRKGHTVVLVPRNLSFVRGSAWLCEIVEHVAAAVHPNSECHFFLTGVAVDVYGRAGHLLRLLQRQMDGMRGEARQCLHLLGGVPHEAMPAAYSASDIVLIPTFAFESTSLAALEAMSFGLPVVATNVGGLNDVVRHGSTGFLVPPDPRALAAAVVQLARDAQLRTRLGAEGRRLAVAAFTEQRWHERAEHFARQAGWAKERVFVR